MIKLCSWTKRFRAPPSVGNVLRHRVQQDILHCYLDKMPRSASQSIRCSKVAKKLNLPKAEVQQTVSEYHQGLLMFVGKDTMPVGYEQPEGAKVEPIVRKQLQAAGLSDLVKILQTSSNLSAELVFHDPEVAKNVIALRERLISARYPMALQTVLREQNQLEFLARQSALLRIKRRFFVLPSAAALRLHDTEQRVLHSLLIDRVDAPAAIGAKLSVCPETVHTVLSSFSNGDLLYLGVGTMPLGWPQPEQVQLCSSVPIILREAGYHEVAQLAEKGSEMYFDNPSVSRDEIKTLLSTRNSLLSKRRHSSNHGKAVFMAGNIWQLLQSTTTPSSPPPLLEILTAKYWKVKMQMKEEKKPKKNSLSKSRHCGDQGQEDAANTNTSAWPSEQKIEISGKEAKFLQLPPVQFLQQHQMVQKVLYAYLKFSRKGRKNQKKRRRLSHSKMQEAQRVKHQLLNDVPLQTIYSIITQFERGEVLYCGRDTMPLGWPQPDKAEIAPSTKILLRAAGFTKFVHQLSSGVEKIFYNDEAQPAVIEGCRSLRKQLITLQYPASLRRVLESAVGNNEQGSFTVKTDSTATGATTSTFDFSLLQSHTTTQKVIALYLEKTSSRFPTTRRAIGRVSSSIAHTTQLPTAAVEDIIERFNHGKVMYLGLETMPLGWDQPQGVDIRPDVLSALKEAGCTELAELALIGRQEYLEQPTANMPKLYSELSRLQGKKMEKILRFQRLLALFKQGVSFPLLVQTVGVKPFQLVKIMGRLSTHDAKKRYHYRPHTIELENNKSSSAGPPRILSGMTFAKLSLEEKITLVDATARYWENKGFPHLHLPKNEKMRKLRNMLMPSKTAINIPAKIVSGSGHSILASCYFPHMTTVKRNIGGFSPMEVFQCPVRLRIAIWRHFEVSHGATEILARGLNSTLFILEGKGVSNFKPKSAAEIYRLFGGTGGTVWDMSCGWGGRLLGAALGGVSKYIGTEPSTATFARLHEMSRDLYFDRLLQPMEVELHCMGSEDFKPTRSSLDLCFTSPPYFNTELYCHEPTQSWKKYPTKEQWVAGFLTQTLENCFVGLKPGKLCVVNLANTNSYPTGEQDLVKAAKSVGFVHIDTWKYPLNTFGQKGKDSEPMFLFQKPGGDSKQRWRPPKSKSELPQGRKLPFYRAWNEQLHGPFPKGFPKDLFSTHDS